MVHVKLRSVILLVVCLLFPVSVGLGVLRWVQAADHNFPDYQVWFSPTKVQPKLVSGLSGHTRLGGERPYLPNYGKLPISFEANRGQTDSRVRFLAHGRGYTLFLTSNEAVLAPKKDVAPVLRSAPAGLKEGAITTPTAQLPRLLSSSVPWEPLEADAEMPHDWTPRPALSSPSSQTGSSEVGSVLRMRLIGANASAQITGVNQLPGKVNYFIGNDPNKWRTNVANYSKVKYQNVYPGVDLVYYGNQRQLEYDFIVAPGADPSAIILDVGAVSESSKRGHRDAPLRIDPNGDLVVGISPGEARFHKPVIYQPAITKRRGTRDHRQRALIEGKFILQAGNQVGFKVAPYDHSKPLVIDPVLSYSTYLGGSSGDVAQAIAVDSSGNAYVTGFTSSPDFPSVNPLQAADRALPSPNVFVAKLSYDGSALVYSTYLGGSGLSAPQYNVYYGDYGYGIAVDSSGNAYVTGDTSSQDFPTVDALEPTPHNAFVAKLNPTGSALVYSTYLGGSGFDHGYSIAADSSGDAYVTGATTSADFPTANPLQATDHSAHGYNAYVAKFNPAGSALVYSTFLGGSVNDFGRGIAVDSSDNVYVAGYTQSRDFPTANPIQAVNHAQYLQAPSNAFIAKLNAVGSALVYSTYLGGSNWDQGNCIAVDASGNAYVGGYAGSTDFPTVNPFQARNRVPPASGEPTGFVAKLNNAGSALEYSTYLGGSVGDYVSGIGVDSSGNAYVTGWTYSTDFPTVNPLQTSPHGVFAAKLNSSGSALVYSTYLGGSGPDMAFGIAVDSIGSAYVAGTTGSTDFPTVNPLQASNHGGSDAFVAKISTVETEPSVSFSPLTLTFGPQNVGATSPPQTETIANAGTANLILSTVTLGGANANDFATNSDTCTGTTLAPKNSCSLSLTFTPSVTGSLNASLIFADNASNSPQTISLTGVGGTTPAVAGIMPSVLTFSSVGIGTTSEPQQVTLSNTGSEALTITNIATSANFSQTSFCGTSLPGGGSCPINVTFLPSALGTYIGTLTVTDNSNGVTGSTQSVELSGTGQDFTLAAAAGSSTSATVAPGQTATYTLGVVPSQGGFNESVNFTCQSPVPEYTNCTFSPNAVTPGSSLTNVTLTMTTTAPSIGQPRSQHFPPVPPLVTGLRVLGMFAFGLAWMAWAIRRRKRPGVIRWKPIVVPLATGLLLALALAACGGAGSGGGAKTTIPGTPAGTYPLVITGTAGSGSSTLSHSVTLTLIVS